MPDPSAVAVVLADGRAARTGERPAPFVAADGVRIGEALRPLCGGGVAVLVDGEVATPRVRKGVTPLAKGRPATAVVVAIGRPAESADDVTGTARRAAPLRAVLKLLGDAAVTLVLDPREDATGESAALLEAGLADAVVEADDGRGRSEISGVAGGGLFATAFVAACGTLRADAGPGGLGADELDESLAADVTRLSRESFTTRRRQRPRVVARGGRVPWPAAGEAESVFPGVTLAFDRVDVRPLRSFKQFTKSDRPPEAATASANRFVAARLKPAIEAAAEEAAGRFREAFGFTRREVSTGKAVDGGVTVATPRFEFHVDVAVDADDPRSVRWRERLTRVETAGEVAAGRFDDAFPDGFTTVRTPTRGEAAVAGLIDRFEREGRPVRYDRDATTAEVDLDGPGWTLTASGTEVAVTAASPRGPSELLRRLSEISTA